MGSRVGVGRGPDGAEHDRRAHALRLDLTLPSAPTASFRDTPAGARGEAAARTASREASTATAAAARRRARPRALIEYAPPTYPDRARARGIEGSVSIEVTVLADGTLADVRVVRSSGAAVLDRAAVRAVQAWTFRPATVNGEPVESVLRLPPIRFRLTD